MQHPFTDVDGVNDVHETGPLPEANLEIDLRIRRCAASGLAAVVIVVDGIPATASIPTVVASILGSLQIALGARLQQTRLASVQ
jgi:hypothetical protein